MPTPIVSTTDGQRITVNSLLKTPTIIPRRILSMMDQQFLVDALLRPAPSAPGGAVLYYESTPLFAQGSATVVEEFGEIPTTQGQLGTPRVVRTVKRALGLMVSQEMIDYNNVDAVNTQIEQIRNTMVGAWEDAFLNALLTNPNVQTFTTSTVWSSASSTIRKDLNNSRFLITNAASDAAGKQKFGFRPDTLVISTQSEVDFLNSNEVSQPYVGNLASENLLYTGKLPNKFLDLDVVVSWRLPAHQAVLLQRKVVGGVSDSRPLQATPMYEDRNRETWRTNVSRASAIFVDQPKAAVVLNGVN